MRADPPNKMKKSPNSKVKVKKPAVRGGNKDLVPVPMVTRNQITTAQRRKRRKKGG